MRLIAHISDVHFGRHDPGITDALLHQIHEMQPHLVVLSGDLTQRARTNEFVQARHFLDRIGRPLLIVPGNHDIPLYNLVHRFGDPLWKYRRHIPGGLGGNDWYADEELAVLGINTARSLTFASGRVSLDQMTLIRRAFAHVPDIAWRIVVTHHPIAGAHGEPRIELAGRSLLALRAIADAGVHLLLSGHYHRPVSGHANTELLLENAVLVVHAGTAVSTRTRDEQGNSYNLIRLDGAHAEIETMKWHPDRGFERSRCDKYQFRAGHLEPEAG
jgi:3',5'-cyclic AMP phosphodiesterase CpdA